MKTARTFTMNGKNYNTLMDIARDLGVKRVYPRDFDKYGIVETTQTNDTQVKGDVQQDNTANSQQATDKKAAKKKTDKEATKVTATKKSTKVANDAADKKADEPKVDKRFTRKLGTLEQVQEALDKAGKVDVIEFNNYIKHFSLNALETIAVKANVKLWDDITNESIRKMRLLMEIKAHFYPTQKTPVKPNSEWRKVDLNDLLSLAKDKKLDFKQSPDEKIQRMRVIMAIKAAGLTLQDLPQKVATND